MRVISWKVGGGGWCSLLLAGVEVLPMRESPICGPVGKTPEVAAFSGLVQFYITLCFSLFHIQIFGLYSHLTGIPLTPAKAFLAVSLLNQLVTPLADFTVYMNVVLNAKVSINRILRFLESPERLMKETSIQGVPNQVRLGNINFFSLFWVVKW